MSARPHFTTISFYELVHGKPPPDDSGFVYFIRDHYGFTKIGCSSNPKDRLAALQTANPMPLTLVAMIKTNDRFRLEKLFHSLYDDGYWFNEWYELTDAMISQVKTFLALSFLPDNKAELITRQGEKIILELREDD